MIVSPRSSPCSASRRSPIQPFGPVAEPLGAVLNLTESGPAAVAELGNRESRVTELEKDIGSIVGEGRVSQRVLASVRGRLLFSRSLCFGRPGGVALRALSEAMAAPGHSVQVTPALCDSLGLLVRHWKR